MGDTFIQAIKNKKYLIFDFDETLFHIHLDWIIFRETIHKEMKKIDPLLYGTLGIDEEDIKKPGSYQIVEHTFIRHYGKSVIDVIQNITQELETNAVTGYTKNKELYSFLIKNKQKYIFYIWSSNNSKTILPIINKELGNNYFKCIIGKDDVELTKPYPDGYYQIQRDQLGEKKDYIMIGNSLKQDKNAANNAGIDFFHINPPLYTWL